jgi:hypothetical protein
VVTNEQLYSAIGVPMLLHATLIGLAVASSNARFGRVDTRFDAIQVQLRGKNERLDHIQEMWRSELRRLEEVIDARLRHLEER